jgi:phage terminase large subunit
VEIARESIDSINDNDTLDEMLTFVKNEKGRAEAMQGYHDDRVMALAIAYYIREQQAYGVQKDKTIDKTKWSEDMLEDYYNASDEEKIKIEEMYGSRS